MLLMQPSIGSQHVLPAEQEPPGATHATQFPLLHAWPDEQQVFPQGAWPSTQFVTAVTHVDVDGSAHAVPLAQQALPHGVVLVGHPHTPLPASRQAIPLWQQHGPQGVVAAGHGEGPTFVGPEQTDAAAAGRNGLSTEPAVAASAAPPSIFKTPRRLGRAAIARLRSSKY